MENITEQLKEFSALKGLTGPQIFAITAAGKEFTAKTGHVLFKEGEDSNAMYFLLQGRLEVKGKVGHISDIPVFNLVGEMGVISKTPRSATVAALSDIRFFALPREAFYKLIETDKDFGYQFYRNLVDVLINNLRKNNELVEFSQLLQG